MSELAALAAFSLVSAATPGPNNVMLWASGVQFGLNPTLPHAVGTSVGIGSMAVAVAAGLGVLVTTIPKVELGLKVIGSAYLLYLAYQVAGSRVVQRADVAHPLGLGQAAAFQYLNPKAWVFVLAAFTAFRPSGLPILVGSGLMVLTMMIVVLPSALLWAAGGAVLSRLINSPRAGRILSVILAILLACTVAYIWI